MALPTSREITATPAADIPSNVINAIQDAIIGKKFASIPRTFHPTPMPSGAYTLSGEGYIESSGVGGARIAIPTEEGDRVTAITFKAFGNGVVDVTYELRLLANDNVTSTLLGTVTDNNRAAAWGDVTFAVAPTIIGAGQSLSFVAAANAAGARLGRIKVTFDRL